LKFGKTASIGDTI